MIVDHHRNFDKSFSKRIENNKKLSQQFTNRLKLFIENQDNPVLKDHKLKGLQKEYCSFSIGGDLRVIYRRINNDHIILMDIGSHNQVY